ncbi:hypothetical protein MMC25_003737 [Agyrium rufum]|nr:hypothetical protein [Agyrium rufum]
MAEDPQPQSIQDRIAALRLGEVGRAPVTAKPCPPLKPSKPVLEHRPKTIQLPTQNSPSMQNQRAEIGNEPNGYISGRGAVLPPPEGIVRSGQKVSPKEEASLSPQLPPRRPSVQPSASPALPPRRPSDQLSRKGSQESIASTISTISNLSNGTKRSSLARVPSAEAPRPTLRMPAYDPSTLPSLPPKMTLQEKKSMGRIPLNSMKSSSSITTTEMLAPPPRKHSLPARIASRDVSYIMSDTARKLPPPMPTQSTRQTANGTREISPAPLPMPARRLLPPPSPNDQGSSVVVRRQPSPSPSLPIRRENSPIPLTLPIRRDISPNPPPIPKNRDASPGPPPMPTRILPPMDPTPKVNAFAKSTSNTPNNPTPPLVPLASRPDLSKLALTKPNISQSQPIQSSQQSCLLCRDFSAPDAHAAKFPRQSVSSLDVLASSLCFPFPSHTDKARAIFTWLHHNVSYDVVAFFNNAVKRSTPANTLATGLAVCEGYAGLFTALATKAGLESIVVGGYGIGYGISTLEPGQPVPPQESNHAWNAVRIDGGEWKLIDCCWGAGAIQGAGQPYLPSFTPRMFTTSNEDFGTKHHPNNPEHWFRKDGRVVSWREFRAGKEGEAGKKVLVFSNHAPAEGFAEATFTPRMKNIGVSTAPPAANIRFSFGRVCQHWDPIRNGPGQPYVYILATGIPSDGEPALDYLPFDNDGQTWWVDVPAKKLGKPGQTIMVYLVTNIDGASGRGWTTERYLQVKGRKAMGFGAMAAWDLV